MEKELIFATGNAGKLREAREILGPAFPVRSAAEAGIRQEAEETGTTFRENAFLKASLIARLSGKDCFSDDSGLVVDALGGAPGIYSARYAGEDKRWSDNIDKLLHELGDTPDRRARFVCAVCLIRDGEAHFFEGTLEGRIGWERRGKGGFGYDPVFIPDLLAPGVPNTQGISVSEMSEEAKNAISHRGVALGKMAAFLQGR